MPQIHSPKNQDLTHVFHTCRRCILTGTKPGGSLVKVQLREHTAKTLSAEAPSHRYAVIIIHGASQLQKSAAHHDAPVNYI